MNEILYGVPPGPIENLSLAGAGLIAFTIIFIAEKIFGKGYLILGFAIIYTLAITGGIYQTIHIILFLGGVAGLGAKLIKNEKQVNNLARQFSIGAITLIPISTLSSILSSISLGSMAVEIIGLAWMAGTIKRIMGGKVTKKISETNNNYISLNIALLGTAIYVFYLGYLNWMPEAYDAATYTWQITKGASSGSVLNISEIIKITDYMPKGINAVLAIAYKSGGVKLCKIYLAAAALTSSYSLAKELYTNKSERITIKWGETISSLICITSPIIFFSTTQLYQEAITFSSLAILLTEHINDRLEPLTGKKLARMGLIAGACMMIKLYMIYYVLASVIFTINSMRMYKNLTKNILIYISPLTTIGGYYYIRSLIATRNPIFPFYNHIFQSPLYPIKEFKTVYNNKAGLFWPIDLSTDTIGKHMESSVGYIPLTLGILSLIGITLAIYSVIKEVKNKRKPTTIDMYIPLGIYLPTTLILNSQNYSRYASQGILILSIYAVCELSKRRIKKNQMEKIVKPAISIGIFSNVLFMHAPNWSATRHGSSWTLKKGIPTVKSNTKHNWQDDKIISKIINKNYEKNNNARILYLQGSSKPYSGNGLKNKKTIELITDSWHYPQVSTCSQNLKNKGIKDSINVLVEKFDIDVLILDKTSKHYAIIQREAIRGNLIGESEMTEIYSFNNVDSSIQSYEC